MDSFDKVSGIGDAGGQDIVLPNATFWDICTVINIWRGFPVFYGDAEGRLPIGLTQHEILEMTGTRRVAAASPEAPMNYLIGPKEMEAIRRQFSIVNPAPYSSEYHDELARELTPQIEAGQFASRADYEHVYVPVKGQKAYKAAGCGKRINEPSV